MKPFQSGGASDCSKLITGNINHLFANKEPWQVATITATAVLSTVWLWSFINQDESKYSKNVIFYTTESKQIKYT